MYCGLVAKIRASDKDLPVNFAIIFQKIAFAGFHDAGGIQRCLNQKSSCDNGQESSENVHCKECDENRIFAG